MTSYPQGAAHGLWRSSHRAAFRQPRLGSVGLLLAGGGRRVRAGGWLGPALLIFRSAVFSRGLVGLDIPPAAIVAAVGNTSVELLLPEGGSGLQLAWSGGSSVPGIDPVGGPPYGDFTGNGDVRPTARRSPHRWRAIPVGVFSNLIGELGDKHGALDKILTPNGTMTKRFRNTGKPLKRSLADSCGFLEAPVEYGGHVAGGVEFSARSS